jgi:hypothetical protein
MDVDLNPYRVEERDETKAAEARHEHGNSCCPLRFDELPREMQGQVLKWTHARFDVTHHMEVSSNVLGLSLVTHKAMRRLPSVPVVLRYEFNLQRRLADGPQMTARFSRSLDPALKQTALWHSFPRATQTEVQRRPARTFEVTAFSELKFDDLNASMWLFCFVRGGAPRGFVDLPPQWTGFPRNSEVLDEVREKMERVFCLPCRRLE